MHKLNSISQLFLNVYLYFIDYLDLYNSSNHLIAGGSLYDIGNFHKCKKKE